MSKRSRGPIQRRANFEARIKLALLRGPRSMKTEKVRKDRIVRHLFAIAQNVFPWRSANAERSTNLPMAFTIFTPNMEVHFKFSEEQLRTRMVELVFAWGGNAFFEGGHLGEGHWIWSLVCCRGDDWQALNLAPAPHKAMVQKALGSLGHAQIVQFCSLQRFTVACTFCINGWRFALFNDGSDAVWVLKSWLNGTHADTGFTYDLIEGCYCYLNRQRRMIPEHLRTKQGHWNWK